ncbi:MAG: Fic family protein [Candidatus Rokuibacteriota bacterium]
MTRAEAPPGRRVRLAEGGWAHVPAPLPPSIEWDPALVAALSEADRLVGRLAGEGGRLPNPHLLIRPFVRREAVLSSKIEGTRATLGELLAAEAGMAVERSPADLREVGNYVVALEYGIKRLKQLPLSLRLIKELHAKLMTGVRGDRARPGEFRDVQNWIGRPGIGIEGATYVPPPPEHLMPCLDAWEKFLHDRPLPPLVQVALAHYQFEAIHPFRDGNGRVGRLLITLFLVERGVLPTPLLYLSAFFEASRPDYYERLQGVHERGEWEAWLAYFLAGVASQSKDALSRAGRINALLAKWREKAVDAGLPAAVRLLDVLAENPFCTVRGAADCLKVAFTTAQRAVAKLEALGVVKQVNEAKRDRVYCATGLLGILEEPANLDNWETR